MVKKRVGNTSEALFKHGGVAQLGEHLPCKQGVRSAILLISTKGRKGRTDDRNVLTDMGL